MDPNFYKAELYERKRRKDEMRQAEQARLTRLARSNEAVNRPRAPSWLLSSVGQILAGIGARLF